MKPAADSTFQNLSAMRRQGDFFADQLIAEVFADETQKANFRSFLDSLTYNHQLNRLNDFYAVKEVFAGAKKLPDWADQKLMQQGTAFFAVHATAVMNLLGLLSLPYCYAAADGAKVLDLSERIRNKPEHRLGETADFIWDVMAPNAFEPEGKGFVSILKVRLLHAAIRFYTQKSGKWNEALGLPVNQEDMAGTNLSFSLIVVRGLRKFGLTVEYPQQQAFMHLWNVIGFLLGVDERLLPETGKEALQLEEAIRLRNFKISEHGQSLTRSLINYFSTVDASFPQKETMQLMRYLVGDEVADLLALPPQQAPNSTINFLKLVNNFKLFGKGSPRLAYQKQRAAFKKMRAAPAIKKLPRFNLPLSLTS